MPPDDLPIVPSETPPPQDSRRRGWVGLSGLLFHFETVLVGPMDAPVRRNLRVDVLAGSCFGVFLACLNFMPVILRRLGAAPEWIAFYLVQVFIGFILTALTVRFTPKDHHLLATARGYWLLGRISFLFLAFIPGVEWMIVLTLFFWAFEALPIPLYTRIIQLVYPDDLRARALGLVRIGVAIVALLATPVVGWLLDQFGTAPVFIAGGIFGSLSTLLFGQLKLHQEEVPTVPSVERKPQPLGALPILMQNKRFTAYLASVVIFGLGLYALTPLFPLVQVDRLGLSYAAIARLGVVQSAFFLLGYFVLGRFIDQFGGILALRNVFMLGLVVSLSFIFAQGGWMLAPAFAAVGFINAGIDIGLLSTVIQLADRKRIAEYSTLQTTVAGLRGLAAPFLGVWLMNLGMSINSVFVVGAVLMMLAVVVMALARQVAPVNFFDEVNDG